MENSCEEQSLSKLTNDASLVVVMLTQHQYEQIKGNGPNVESQTTIG